MNPNESWYEMYSLDLLIAKDSSLIAGVLLVFD
jgi:hypothetical protein